MPSLSANSPTQSSPSQARACSIRRRVVLASTLKVDPKACAWRTESKGRAASAGLVGHSIKVFLGIRNSLSKHYTISCNKQVFEFPTSKQIRATGVGPFASSEKIVDDFWPGTNKAEKSSDETGEH